ncbi:hypothetical protein V8G54_034266 [Vigna mungo]|uniref:Uncharacterized protein n=1 Tax=Vigna mungo TaxID=3915 RepID=A0AAQ3RH48_VIGMU
MDASSSRPGKRSVSAMREVNPSGWISDDNVRERFLGLRMFNKFVKHETIELSLFCYEKFAFPEKLWFQGLDTFAQLKGDCYPELVEVFYNNVKEVDRNIHSRVKGVEIVINNDTWLKIASLKDEGRLSHQLDCLQNKRTMKPEMFKNCMRYRERYRKKKRFLFKWLDKEDKIIVFIIGHILLPGRPNLIKLTPKDVYLLNAIMRRIPTNWVVAFKWHILDVGINNWHRLPYGVKKLTCSKANLIGKATLTCIGLKRTTSGWIFSDELNSAKGKETLVDSDSDQDFPPSKSNASKRINTLKKSLTTLHEKMDEIFKHCVDISTSSKESKREDVDEVSEESFTESSESE